ncbi:hypothetical protein SKAU_G00353590 [Synaphobranchus kaupii]|uniref:Uncharacterized protein n=1 Tax=Synaphobranchus kaupii TaxID=118154 RepID=A0A9Q1IIE7_SYNKA|nr:hypothetical protein SKAU_G00353590 [Synaphobranchus kaupii]
MRCETRAGPRARFPDARGRTQLYSFSFSVNYSCPGGQGPAASDNKLKEPYSSPINPLSPTPPKSLHSGTLTMLAGTVVSRRRIPQCPSGPPSGAPVINQEGQAGGEWWTGCGYTQAEGLPGTCLEKSQPNKLWHRGQEVIRREAPSTLCRRRRRHLAKSSCLESTQQHSGELSTRGAGGQSLRPPLLALCTSSQKLSEVFDGEICQKRRLVAPALRGS